MLFFPDMYCKNVQSIEIDSLRDKKIKGIAIDVDNTLIDYKQILSEEVKNWIKKVKENGFKICILSILIYLYV